MSEQYQLHYSIGNRNLVRLLKSTSPFSIFIRQIGSLGGETMVKEKLQDRKLLVRSIKDGLDFYIDAQKVFHFEQRDNHDRQHSVVYERVDSRGVIILPSTGINPSDSNLPEPRTSEIHGSNSEYYWEIAFQGRVPLKFHSKPKPGDRAFNYWQINFARLERKTHK